MAVKRSHSSTYTDYIAALKSVVTAKTCEEFPRLVVITGSSGFLQLKACQAVMIAWNKLDFGEAQSLETADLDQSNFHSLWSQSSLFEPESLYVLRRAGAVRALGSWLGGIKSQNAIKSHLVIECGDKLNADVTKQITRLQGVLIHCTEPRGSAEFMKVAHALCKRNGIELEDDAMKLILDSMGHDLGKIDNEIAKLSLQFAGRNQRLTRLEISGSIGSLREDDVFELFDLLRNKRSATAHLLAEHFLDRGESAIALTGIFARYSREQIERGSLKKGLLGLRTCAEADRRLKSSRIDESLVMSTIIEALAEV